VSGYADNIDIDPGYVRLEKPFRAEEFAYSHRETTRQRRPELMHGPALGQSLPAVFADQALVEAHPRF
jgi:hypothetical protein